MSPHKSLKYLEKKKPLKTNEFKKVSEYKLNDQLYFCIPAINMDTKIKMLILWWIILYVSFTGLRNVQILGKTVFLSISAGVF